MTRGAAPLIINERPRLVPVGIFVCAWTRTRLIRSAWHHLNNALCSGFTSPSPHSLCLQVKPNCKSVPNGKLTPAAKYKANGLSKRSSAEEKERGKEREKEREERSEREENKDEETSEESRAEEQTFLVSLYKYMKDRDTPIERIPFLGFKQSE